MNEPETFIDKMDLQRKKHFGINYQRSQSMEEKNTASKDLHNDEGSQIRICPCSVFSGQEQVFACKTVEQL